MKATRAALSPTAVAMFGALDVAQQAALLTVMRYSAGLQRFRSDRVFNPEQWKAQRRMVREHLQRQRANAKARKGRS